MSNKSATIAIIAIILIVALLGGGYWLYMMKTKTGSSGTTTSGGNSGFIPLNRSGQNGSSNTTTTTTSPNNQNLSNPTSVGAIPVLRLLSNTPVGGYGASTTASTTFVRWVDRGRGNIYEAQENSSLISTLSNTLLPRVIDSVWNKNLTSFIGPIVQDDKENPVYVYSSLVGRSVSPTSTTSRQLQTLSPYTLSGKNLPQDTLGFAVSPEKTSVLTLVKNDIGSVAYLSGFDGSTALTLFTTPLTQLNIDWPASNTIALTNKGIADRAGFLYFVNPKSGSWKRILGPLKGLGTKVSTDGKKVFMSVYGGNNDIVSGIYNVASSTALNVSLHTLADKCVWGNFYKEIVYCAVPHQQIVGVYPDDWYFGTLSTSDDIWQINSFTGETKLVAALPSMADRAIDAYNLGVDAKDNFLFFMNKTDLTLWSLDLVRSH